jgi:glycosyltransferase involved in cell wall biosynthesis
MKVSIIIPVYNSEKYLGRCLDSILAQTYSKLEIILVNDGSKDGSLALCELYAKEDARVILINQVNKGPAAARNVGIKSATGEYIGFVDSDDFIDASMYENLGSIASKLGPDIVVSNFIQYDSNNVTNTIIRNSLPYGKLLSRNEIKEYFIIPYYCGGGLGIIPSLWNKIYKTDFIKTNYFTIDETLIRAEDYWFNFYAFKSATTIFAIDRAFYHYFKNEGSIMHTFRENQFDLFVKSREKLLFENEQLNCKIDWKSFDTEFIHNTNEYVLICIKKTSVFKSYKKVSAIFRNEKFKNALENVSINNLHNRLIKRFLKYKLNMPAYLIYYSWSLKI